MVFLKVCSCVLATHAFPQGDRQQQFSQGDRQQQQFPQQFAEARDGFAEARDGAPASKTPGGFFQYVNVPAHKEYEFGWNRGTPEHYISRYEQNKDHRFRTRV